MEEKKKKKGPNPVRITMFEWHCWMGFFFVGRKSSSVKWRSRPYRLLNSSHKKKRWTAIMSGWTDCLTLANQTIVLGGMFQPGEMDWANVEKTFWVYTAWLPGVARASAWQQAANFTWLWDRPSRTGKSLIFRWKRLNIRRGNLVVNLTFAPWALSLSETVRRHLLSRVAFGHFKMSAMTIGPRRRGSSIQFAFDEVARSQVDRCTE